MNWLRRALDGGDDRLPGSAQAPADEDSPDALRRLLAEEVRRINRSAGQLPGAAVVAARRLTDTLLDVIYTNDIRKLDVYAAITVRSTLTDYLPTSIRRYLAVPAELRDSARGTGTTPTDSLLAQLADLQAGATAVLAALQHQDADALLTQGSFLRTKFSGSDLDL